MSDLIYRLGCDIGGTFTDFVLLNQQTGETEIQKLLTTPDDPSRAVLEGVKRYLKDKPDMLSRMENIIHGTTLIINAIIERKGAVTALITTRGFRDILEMGREKRYDIYDVFISYPPPLVPRHLRREVGERINRDGLVIERLKVEDASKVAAELAGDGVESIAVCFLHSFVNPEHERLMGQVLEDTCPQIPVSLSSEVLPEIREYERTSTTVANAYVHPLTHDYLNTLREDLRSLGFNREFFVMLSSGGTASLETAIKYPIRICESGPAAGAMAARFFGLAAGISNLLSFDMGGTTAKSCLITGGEVAMTQTYEVARMHRFKKGSGIPLRIPVIDLMETGAGGGSIARIDTTGLLKVGPMSAGAEPGPVCYSGGGTEPTVSDADLCLGYLNPDYFLGGQMRLDHQGARRAIDEQIAKPLKVSTIEAAWGIHSLVNENMSSAVRMQVAEKGLDISSFALVAFGGAGPVHAYNLAHALGVSDILVPFAAGVTSALGFFTVPLSFEHSRTHKVPVLTADMSDIERVFGELEDEGRRILAGAGYSGEVQFSRAADARYVGQGFEITFPLPQGDPAKGEAGAQKVLDAFNERYKTLYGRLYPDIPVELVTLRSIARGPEPHLQLRRPELKKGRAADAIKGKREAYSPAAGRMTTHTVYDRYLLPARAALKGPAIIEERECTTIIGDGGQATVDDHGTLIIKVGA